jgi:hypothetical protein
MEFSITYAFTQQHLILHINEVGASPQVFPTLEGSRLIRLSAVGGKGFTNKELGQSSEVPPVCRQRPMESIRVE